MASAPLETKAVSTIVAAHRYHVTRSYVARLARAGAIVATKFGRDWLINESSLQAYLSAPQKRGPKARVPGAVQTSVMDKDKP
ncbi:MAG: helix-turn-helix domain-containing protein [Ktedonobacterales bacterium]|nr:helix-turn-helix domain-containing protein [Ktedonobacterales bacterium]